VLRLTWRDRLRDVAVGAGVGALVLGIGGRSAMRGIAILSGAPPSFSFGGSLRVVLLGALAGLVGGLILLGLRALLPKRWLIQTLLFYVMILLITLRGLRPIDAQRLMLFLPLVLAYGFLVRTLTRRRRPVSEEALVES